MNRYWNTFFLPWTIIGSMCGAERCFRERMCRGCQYAMEILCYVSERFFSCKWIFFLAQAEVEKALCFWLTPAQMKAIKGLGWHFISDLFSNSMETGCSECLALAQKDHRILLGWAKHIFAIATFKWLTESEVLPKYLIFHEPMNTISLSFKWVRYDGVWP